MDVWRLPPILAIQLKRFQYTQYSRRKLRNNVHVSKGREGRNGEGNGGGRGGGGDKAGRAKVVFIVQLD